MEWRRNSAKYQIIWLTHSNIMESMKKIADRIVWSRYIYLGIYENLKWAESEAKENATNSRWFNKFWIGCGFKTVSTE